MSSTPIDIKRAINTEEWYERRDAEERRASPYTKVPAVLHQRLKGKHFVIFYLLLYHRNRSTGECFPKVATLAEESGLTAETVGLALSDLERDGWIRREHRYRPDGGQTSSQYWLMIEESPSDEQGGTRKNRVGGYPEKPGGGLVVQGSITTTPSTYMKTMKSTNTRLTTGAETPDQLFNPDGDDLLPMPEPVPPPPPATEPSDPVNEVVRRWNDTATKCKGDIPSIRVLSPKLRGKVREILRLVKDPVRWERWWKQLPRQRFIHSVLEENWFCFEFCFRNLENWEKIERDWMTASLVRIVKQRMGPDAWPTGTDPLSRQARQDLIEQARRGDLLGV